METKEDIKIREILEKEEPLHKKRKLNHSLAWVKCLTMVNLDQDVSMVGL